MKILILILFVLTGNFMAAQTKPKMTKFQAYARETSWEVYDIKTLLEQKLDESKISKQEMQKWIIDKLNSYLINQYQIKGRFMYNNPVDEKPFYEYETHSVLSKHIFFSDRYLILHFSFKITNDNWSQPKYEERTDSVYIPDLKTILYERQQLSLWNLDNSTHGNTSTIYNLNFDLNRETEIGLRLKKAFVHLCSFYWHSVKNESF